MLIQKQNTVKTNAVKLNEIKVLSTANSFKHFFRLCLFLISAFNCQSMKARGHSRDSSLAVGKLWSALNTPDFSRPYALSGNSTHPQSGSMQGRNTAQHRGTVVLQALSYRICYSISYTCMSCVIFDQKMLTFGTFISDILIYTISVFLQTDYYSITQVQTLLCHTFRHI